MPAPRSIIPGRNARFKRTAANRLTLRALCQSSSVSARNPPFGASDPPRQFTRISNPCQSCWMRSTTFRTPSAVPMSVCTNKDGFCPSGNGERAVVATAAPLNKKRRTIASPIPLVPPVTRTRLLLNSSLETANGYVCVIESNLQRGNLRIDLLRYEVDTILVKWEVHTKKYARDNMPKRYTPVTAAANLEKALRLLEGRWKLVILFHLFGGKIMRFSDLERAIPAITQKMLGQQLKAMEADGIVLRTAYPQVPPKVEYSLTSWGQSLCPALDAILKWADRRPAHVRKVSETRRPKDGSSARPRTAPE